jgi:ubiquinone biosynthesis protein
LLSTRTDLLGEQVAADLARLRDRLPPFPAAAARATIERELGQPIGRLFAAFDDNPVSAASIAQVHYAVLPDGDPFPQREVAVKVLRPGIEEAFRRDIDMLAWLAALIERTAGLAAVPAGRGDRDLRQITEREMDLRRSRRRHRARGEFTGDDSYVVPRSTGARARRGAW